MCDIDIFNWEIAYCDQAYRSEYTFPSTSCPFCVSVFLYRRAAARYRALASIIRGRKRP